ncbi:glycosyltransferase family 2 protein [Microbulbifer sp. S227A]|uniref:glycosyltransferase family 2 protein n=1 Tax=Microbulbifer sp. S227A TaxID=3415131 RepID=UPI003C7DF9A7
MQTAAALTMVRDDAFFLKAWLRHYGGLLGRENCYVVNHGRGEVVAGLADGCNVIGIPGDAHKNFDMKRWRMLNNLVMGLRCYYEHVIVGDVDELVVLDPQAGTDLPGFLASVPPNRVLTPLGLEVIHRVDLEHDVIDDHVLGPRRHVRPAPHYSKPCVVSSGTKIARGGHFTQYERLHTPDHLYLLHLKFCDLAAYTEAMDRRNAVSAATGAGIKEAAIGRHWFAETRGDDRAEFEAFSALRMQDGFEMGPLRKRMHRTWRKRGETGYWEFDRPEFDTQYLLPERFSGLV